MAELRKVAVIGAGNMGSGIAQKTAQEGLDVVMIDLKPEFVERGLETIKNLLGEAVERRIFSQDKVEEILGRIKGATDMGEAADADLVIEAVFEDKKVKSDLFANLNQICKPETVLATNTSSFKVGELAEASGRPDRFVGLHFFYHPAKNRLLEVIPGDKTSPQTLELALKYARLTAKTDISTADAPGFAVNRFFVPWLNEAARLLEEGAANIPTIDEAAKEAFKIGMGPFLLMNVTGVPIAFHASTTLGEEIGPFYAPAGILAEQAEKGEWDLSGEVEADKKPAVIDRLLGVVFLVACELVDEGVATMTDTDTGAKVGLRWRLGPFELMNKNGVERAAELVEKIVARYPDRKMPRLLAEQKAKGEPFDLRYVTYRREGEIGYITFNRPEAMNALNPTVVRQLDEAVDRALADAETKAVVLEGKGKAFVAGADIGYFIKNIKKDDIDAIYEFTAFGHEVLKKLERADKPTIAKLDGLSLGGGSELALACQCIVATERGSMGFPETGIGIYPGLGGTQRTPRRVGPALAKYLVLTGRVLGGKTLVEAGLADYFFPSSEVDDKIKELVASGQVVTKDQKEPPTHVGQLAELAGLFQEPGAYRKLIDGAVPGENAAKIGKILAAKAPVALSLADRLIDDGLNKDLDSALATELANLHTIFKTEDALLGLSNIGRKVEYKGR